MTFERIRRSPFLRLFGLVFVVALSLYGLTSSPSKKSRKSKEDVWDKGEEDRKFFCQRTFPVIKTDLPSRYKLKKDITALKVPFDMYIYAKDDIVSKNIDDTGMWEREDTLEILAQLESYAKANGLRKDEVTFIDIGANVGWFSVAAAASGYSVISFEPMAINEFVIRSNQCLFEASRGYNRWVYINRGLGSERASCKMISYIHNAGDGLTVCDDRPINADYTINEYLEVERLDDILSPAVMEKLHIGAVKMDVENFERFVVTGGQKFFASPKVNRIKMEFLYAERDVENNKNTDFVFNWLLDHGFSISSEGFFKETITVRPKKSIEAYVWK